MPANPDRFNSLVSLFAEYGLESFINSTRSLIALLSGDGKLLAWNPAFDPIEAALHNAILLRDFLSPSSRTVLFDLLLSTVMHDRLKTQGELDLGQGDRLGGYTCFLHLVPDARILFIAEPTHAVSDLELFPQNCRIPNKKLERKETELRAVLAQAHEVSQIDSLTFLPNRRQIMVDIQNAVTFSDRYGTPLTI